MKTKKRIVHLGFPGDDAMTTTVVTLCGYPVVRFDVDNHHRWESQIRHFEHHTDSENFDPCKKCREHPDYPLHDLNEVKL